MARAQEWCRNGTWSRSAAVGGSSNASRWLPSPPVCGSGVLLDSFTVDSSSGSGKWRVIGGHSRDGRSYLIGLSLHDVSASVARASNQLQNPTVDFAGLFALHERALASDLRATFGGRLDSWRELDGHRALRDTAERLLQMHDFWVSKGRLGRPEELAEYAAFMSSDRNSFMNGEIVIVDGGAVT